MGEIEASVDEFIRDFVTPWFLNQTPVRLLIHSSALMILMRTHVKDVSSQFISFGTPGDPDPPNVALAINSIGIVSFADKAELGGIPLGAVDALNVPFKHGFYFHLTDGHFVGVLEPSEGNPHEGKA